MSAREYVHDPLPEERVAVQRVPEESEKVTVPVGVPVYSGATVALKVTVSPETSPVDGEMVIAVEEVAFATLRDAVAEEVEKFESPL